MNGDAKHSIIPPVYSLSELSESQRTLLLKRPLIDSKEMLGRVQPILNEVSVKVTVEIVQLPISIVFVTENQRAMQRCASSCRR